jgi:hypothetical protein
MPLVVVGHPIALTNDAAIAEKADGAIEDVVRTLVGNHATSA